MEENAVSIGYPKKGTIQSKGKKMTRNLKTLGVALAAVLAISAVAASAAVAQQGTLTSDGPVTQIATQTGGAGSNALSAFGLSIECPGSTYTGHKYNVTPHAFIPNGAVTATLMPYFKEANHNCRANPGNFPLTIDLNGCDDVVHLGETTGGVAGTYAVTLDFVCSVGQEVAVTMWTTTTDETKPTEPFCVLHIPPQTGLKGLHVTDTGNGHVDFNGTIEGVKSSMVKSTHAILCPAKETTTGKISLDLTGSGLNSVGGATAISLSHP